MKLFTCVSATALALLLLICCGQPAPDVATATAQKPAQDPVKRGEYLVAAMGCNDCHSPKIMTDHGPVPDPARLLSGHPAAEPLAEIPAKDVVRSGQWVMFNPSLTAGAGPWGITYAANLTPDETGLGSWSFAQFKKALVEGKYKGLDGGRMLQPPMPWPNYRNMTDDDLQAMFAYLQSLPPIKNKVPEPVPPTAL